MSKKASLPPRLPKKAEGTDEPTTLRRQPRELGGETKPALPPRQPRELGGETKPTLPPRQTKKAEGETKPALLPRQTKKAESETKTALPPRKKEKSEPISPKKEEKRITEEKVPKPIKSVKIRGVNSRPIEDFSWLDTGVYYEPLKPPKKRANKYVLPNISVFPSFVIDRWADKYRLTEESAMTCEKKDKAKLPYWDGKNNKKIIELDGVWEDIQDNDEDNRWEDDEGNEYDEEEDEDEKDNPLDKFDAKFIITDDAKNKDALKKYIALGNNNTTYGYNDYNQNNNDAVQIIKDRGQPIGFYVTDREEFDGTDKKMFPYQEFISAYMNINTPYRGILLYHGLGSGKSRTAIEVAKYHIYYKPRKEIVFMGPAALVDNFIKESYKWGLINKDLYALLYTPGTSKRVRREILREYGIYIVNYNGNRKLDQLSYALTPAQDLNKGVLKNKIIIIDEVHNLVLAMTNDIKKPQGVGQSGRIYDILMNAVNCRFVCLSGTPMINKPQELAVLFNIIRGPMKYNEARQIQGNYKGSSVKNLNENLIRLNKMHKDDKTQYRLFPISSDFSEFNKEFVDLDNITIKNREEFMRRIMGLVSYYSGAKGKVYPDIVKENKLKKTNEAVEEDTIPWELQRTYLSMVDIQTDPDHSEAEETQLDQYDYYRIKEEKKPVGKKSSHIAIKSKGSGIHKRLYKPLTFNQRVAAMNLKLDSEKAESTYRTFSRQISNFMNILNRPQSLAKPANKAARVEFYNNLIEHPEYFTLASEEGDGILNYASPKMTQILENVNKLTANPDEAEQTIQKNDELLQSLEEEIERINGEIESYDVENLLEGEEEQLEELNNDLDEKTLEKESIETSITVQPSEVGCGLIYSNYRSAEGIEYMARVLEQNGYTYFDYEHYMRYLKNEEESPAPDEEYDEENERWQYDGKRYAILGRDIRKNNQDFTTEIIIEFNKPDNKDGKNIKLLLGTANISEGLDLKNVRHIHIMEPHWNMVRINQVIGRARRICSHAALDDEQWTIRVFLYLAILPEGYIDPVTHSEESTDEVIYNIALAKEALKNEFIKAIREAAVDCVLNAVHNTPKSGKKPVCLYYPKYEPISPPGPSNQLTYTYYPKIENDQKLNTLYESFDTIYQSAKKGIELVPYDTNPPGKLDDYFYTTKNRIPKFMVPVNIEQLTIRIKGSSKNINALPLYDHQIYLTTNIPHFLGYLTNDMEIIYDISKITVISGQKYL